MILDQEQVFADRLAVTSTAVATNVKDLAPFGGNPTANAFRDIGAGRPLWLYILVTETFDTAGEAGTCAFSLESDDNTDLSSATEHWNSGAIAEATLVAGYEIKVQVPIGEYQRYVGIRATVASGPFTAGKYIAALVNDVDVLRQYRGAEPNSVS